MVLETNVGIICSCLSGVKPVLARAFPTIFGTSYRSRSDGARPRYSNSGRAHGDAFHPLSDISNRNKPSVRKLKHACSIKELITATDNGQRNFAWASSDGKTGADAGVPPNAIGINQVVLVEEEDTRSITSRIEAQKKLSDAGSEEWIMDGPRQHAW